MLAQKSFGKIFNNEGALCARLRMAVCKVHLRQNRAFVGRAGRRAGRWAARAHKCDTVPVAKGPGPQRKELETQCWRSSLGTNFGLFRARAAPQPTSHDDTGAADAATDDLPPTECVQVSDGKFVNAPIAVQNWGNTLATYKLCEIRKR